MVKSLKRSWNSLIFIVIIIAFPLILNAETGQIVSGPYSLTIRGGGQGDSASFGMDSRADFLNPKLNLHLFGTYDWLNSENGIGEYDSQRYGAGLAVSHTYSGKANAFLGTAFINELGENFGHIYLGGKFKVSESTLVSGSYGIGLGNEKTITNITSRVLLVESVNWAKLGIVYVTKDRLKTNLYYYLTDPGDENISGVEGEVSYPVTDFITVGVRGQL